MKNERPGPKSGPKRGEKPGSKPKASPELKRDPRPGAEPGTRKDAKPSSKFGPRGEAGGTFSPKTKADKNRLAGKTGEGSRAMPTGKPGGKTNEKLSSKQERTATQAFPPKRYINVYFSLGSNMGDRQANLRAAASLIDKNIGKIARKSYVYETEPWGEPAQDKFLNQVIMANTTLDPRDLLEIITAIEKDLGRVKKEKWGPRTIDIDILFYGKRVIRDKGLDIPHPELHKRNFVLVPLMEIAPDLEHPVLKQPIDELYMNCKDPGEVVQLD